jgi:hypothetical protein
MTYKVILNVFGTEHILVDSSLKVLGKQVIEILEQTQNQWSAQAIKFVRQQRFFFRIDRGSKITCEMSKI